MIPTWLGLLMGTGMGVLTGMGVGGGKLLVPALVVFFSVKQQAAQGVALVAFVPIALVAGYVHRQAGVVNVRAALWLVAGSVLGAVIGATLALYVGNQFLQKAYGAFLTVMAVYEMFNKEGTK